MRLKDVLGTWIGKLKGKGGIETAENCSILAIFIGAAMLSIGLGLTVITPKGLPAILTMLGALVAFISTIALILVWALKDMVGESNG